MAATNLRQRVPFRLSDDADQDKSRILDDQEQEEVIDNLRRQNASSSKQLLLAIGGILSLSCLLQLIYMLSSSKASPLFAIAPTESNTEESVPLPNVFSCLSIAIHVNLVMLLHPKTIQDWNLSVKPLSYATILALSTVAPALCILLGRSWQTVVWWSFTTLVVLMVGIVQMSIAASEENIGQLEKLKYTAPGA